MSNPNPVISRNGIQKEFEKQVVGKKSETHAGKEFFAPVCSEESLQDDVKWIGATDLIAGTNKWLRQTFFQIYLSNVDKDTGVFNQAQWELDAADFSAGQAKLSDIEEQLDNYQAEQQMYALDEKYEFGATLEDGVTKTPQAIETDKKLKELANKIKPLRIEKATIQAKYEARAAKKAATKAAQEASKPQVAVAA